MDVLAAIRPDEWNLPLFLHILGALGLVGASPPPPTTSSAPAATARRRSPGSASGAALRGDPLLPGDPCVAPRARSKEGLEDSEDAWITIGFIVTDLGLLLIIAATVGAAHRRRAGRRGPVSRGTAVAAWACSFLLVAYTVALWAMATKPV